MKYFLLAAIFLFAPEAFSEVSTEVLCFSSSGKNPIQFELRTYFDSDTKWEGGLVKYSKSKSTISIVLNKTETEITNKDRPYETTKKWLEISNNKISGEYEMMSQGANIYSMQYTNNTNQKKYGFILNTDVEFDVKNGCKWQ
jgi:hypothetical protein